MSRQNDIKKLIIRYERRLQKHKEKQALLGIATPPEILIEIEDIEEELRRLQTDLSKDATEFYAKPHVPRFAPGLPTHFVYRSEIDQCQYMLLTPNALISSRLILLGMGGIGKTTLAIALTNEKEIIEKFKDGILWASLGPDSTVENWQLTWGIALGENLRMIPTSVTKAARLRDILAYKTCLLVIDDVWSKVDVTDLLVGCPNCCTIITTRETNVAQRIGGTVFNLGVLDKAKSLALLSKWAGRDLSRNTDAAQLVELIGHLPLAIRLIGAKLSTGTNMSSILAAFRYESRVSGLKQRDNKTGEQTVFSSTDFPNPLGKDESLRLSFSLSVENLKKNDRDRFIQLAAFANNESFDEIAAGAIWGEFSTNQSAALHLNTLVLHALVMHFEISTNSASQYLVHPLLHSYTQELLEKEDWVNIPYENHTTYYLGLAKHSAEQWKIVERFFGQIRTAFERVRRSPTPDYRLFEFIDTLSVFFERRGLWTVYLEWAKVGLNLAGSLQDRQTEARMLRHISYGYYLLGDLNRGLICSKFSLQYCRRLDDRLGIIHSLQILGHIFRNALHLRASEYCYQQSLCIAKKLKMKTEIADCLGNLGRIHQMLGDWQKGLNYCQQALNLNQELGNTPGLAKEYNNIGLILNSQGYSDKALESYRQALTLAYQLGNKGGIAIALANIGSIYFEQQRYTRAERCLTMTVSLLKELGSNVSEIKDVQNLLSLIRLKVGQ